jgi:hypothetical protein
MWTNNEQQSREERSSLIMDRKMKRAADGEKALKEHEQREKAMLEKTRRLREVRLSKGIVTPFDRVRAE